MLQALKSHEQLIARILIGCAFATFLASMLLYGIEQLSPGSVPDRFTPDSLLACVSPGIIMLLLYELYVLVSSTRGSFIGFIHAQFEVISLIILRDLFKKLDQLSAAAKPELLREIAIVAVGSIILYFFIEVLERIRHNLTFAAYEEDKLHRYQWLRVGKRSLRVVLGLYFVGLVVWELVRWLLGIHDSGFGTQFLTLVFGGLIVYNVVMLFAVLFVANSYETLFEHSALVLASSVVLVALPRDPFISVPLITAALLFVIATLLLHGFARGASLKTLLKVAVVTDGNQRKR